MSLILATLAAVTAPCTMPPGWDAVAARKTRYVVFGEMHGTEQAPEFFGAVACALARKREHLLVAIEFRARENDALQAAWRQPHDRFVREMLANMPEWTAARDGRTSEATLAMLVRLHSEKSAGRRIDIVAFNGDRDDAQKARYASLPGQGSHEAAQADNIRIAAAANRYDHVLVLVGNAHARKAFIERGNVRFEPMAMQLAPADQVTALNMVYASGSSWNCQLRDGVRPASGRPVTRADIECAARPAKGTDLVAGWPQMGLGGLPPASSQNAYDGWFWVGAIAASPPALDAPPLTPRRSQE